VSRITSFEVRWKCCKETSFHVSDFGGAEGQLEPPSWRLALRRWMLGKEGMHQREGLRKVEF
jgi:hypothetical protein